jgi:hypothetical protein
MEESLTDNNCVAVSNGGNKRVWEASDYTVTKVLVGR